jgi:hypothetical protein
MDLLILCKTAESVTSDIYFSLFGEELFPFMMGCGIPLNSTWFRQDGAGSCMKNATFASFICDVFKERV